MKLKSSDLLLILPVGVLLILMFGWLVKGQDNGSSFIGPNASSEECKNLDGASKALTDRYSDQDYRADKAYTDELQRLQDSTPSSVAKETAMNNLSSRYEMAKTGRENKFNNESLMLDAQMQKAGCTINR